MPAWRDKKKAAHTARLPRFFDQTCDPVGVRIAYRCRAYPDPAQQQVLARTFGCVRVVWNRTLAARQVRWHLERKGTSYADSDRALTAMKRDPVLAFLSEVSCVPLQQALRHQHQAFAAFFAGRARYPRFKSRRGRQCAHYTRRAFTLRGGQLRLAKSTAPVRFVLVLAECGRDRAGPGDGDRLPRAGRPLVRDLHRPGRRSRSPAGDRARGRRRSGRDGLRRDQRRAADRQPAAPGAQGPQPGPLPAAPGSLPEGSANRVKAAAKVARAHRKVRDARRDFLHRASTRVVRTADLIVIEDLNVCGMLGNRHLARAIADCGWGEFRRQLAYKCQRYGRELVVINRWYPSSKTCSACGYLLAELSLSTRQWTCPSCGARHDRDVNAAKNILAAGRAVARDSPGDACGAGVRHSGSSRARPAVKQESRPVTAGIPVLQGGE